MRPIVILTGDVVNQIKLIYPNQNSNFCKAVIQVVCEYSQYNYQEQKTEYKSQLHFVEVYGKMAEILVKNQTVFPGFIVQIRAELRTSSYTDKQGIQRFGTTLVLTDFKDLQVVYRKPGTLDKWNLARGKVSNVPGTQDIPNQLPQVSDVYVEKDTNTENILEQQPVDDDIPF